MHARACTRQHPFERDPTQHTRPVNHVDTRSASLSSRGHKDARHQVIVYMRAPTVPHAMEWQRRQWTPRPSELLSGIRQGAIS